MTPKERVKIIAAPFMGYGASGQTWNDVQFDIEHAITEAEIEAAERLLMNATPLPWEERNSEIVAPAVMEERRYSESRQKYKEPHHVVCLGDDYDEGGNIDDNDRQYIVAACNLLPRALAQLRAQAEELADARKVFTVFNALATAADDEIIAAELRGARAGIRLAAREFSPEDYIQTGQFPRAMLLDFAEDNEWLAKWLAEEMSK